MEKVWVHSQYKIILSVVLSPSAGFTVTGWWCNVDGLYVNYPIKHPQNSHKLQKMTYPGYFVDILHFKCVTFHKTIWASPYGKDCYHVGKQQRLQWAGEQKSSGEPAHPCTNSTTLRPFFSCFSTVYPRIKVAAPEVAQAVGFPRTLICEAEGNPVPMASQLIWFKEGVPLVDGPK